VFASPRRTFFACLPTKAGKKSKIKNIETYCKISSESGVNIFTKSKAGKKAKTLQYKQLKFS
jgi:hypothetical protein